MGRAGIEPATLGLKGRSGISPVLGESGALQPFSDSPALVVSGCLGASGCHSVATPPKGFEREHTGAGGRLILSVVVHEWEYQDGAVWGFADRDPGFWSGDVGFETPEEAAAPEIPARFVRVVSVQYHPDGNHAVVELLTNEEPQLYPYTVFCERDSSGRWHEVSGHN